MAESVQHDKLRTEDYVPLSPEERQKAKPVMTKIWKEGHGFLNKQQFQLVPGDAKYAEIRLYGQGDMKTAKEKEDDLVIELIPNDYVWKNGLPKPRYMESFHFSVIKGGPVVKMTAYYSDQGNIGEVYEADKEDLEKLLGLIKNSRTVAEGIVK
jgi:hypothetical protein